jgi:hypothetical protein
MNDILRAGLCSWGRLICTALALSVVAVGTPGSRTSSRTRPARRPEPFRSFDLLDGQLSVLSREQQTLQEIGDGDNSDAFRRRRTTLHLMQVTTRNIESLAFRLHHRYMKQRRRFGTRAFRVLAQRAASVRQRVSTVEKAPKGEAYRGALNELNTRIVGLVVQFQALSGGHAVLRCASRDWTCCEPKRQSDVMPGEVDACRWLCVSRASRCTGLLGPRTPGTR